MANARQIRGGLPEYGYKAQGTGLRMGVMLIIGASNIFAKIGNAIGVGKWRGISLSEGQLPDGAADASIPDSVTAQKTGIARALVPASSSASEGDQAWSDANGKIVKRTPFSFSGFVIGQFDESFTAGSNAEYRGVELIPHYIEVVRSFFFANPVASAIGAATKYLAGYAGAALLNAPIGLCQVAFTGQKLRNLKAQVATAPGGSDTVIVTFVVSTDGGTTWGALASAPTCTITGSATEAHDLTTELSLTAGQLIAPKIVSSAGTAAGLSLSFDLT